MKKYIDSKKGIYTDGYNHYVVDLTVYPFLTDAATINNADEVIGILNKVFAKGGTLTINSPSSTLINMRILANLVFTKATKKLDFVATGFSATGASIQKGTCTYSEGTWTVALSTATTAWDT